MKERPILFSGPMVRAILEDRKTQTRRIVKRNESNRVELRHKQWHIEDPNAVKACPYGEIGDRLWVRETFIEKAWDDNECLKAGCPDAPKSSELYLGQPLRAIHRASCTLKGVGPWTPSIFMPRWASRIALEVTKVRVERLQDITPDDCRAEGMPAKDSDIGVRYCYGQLWNQLNEKRGFGYQTNPWVWVIEFKRI